MKSIEMENFQKVSLVFLFGNPHISTKIRKEGIIHHRRFIV